MARTNPFPKRKKQIPEVIFQPGTFQSMQRGIKKLVSAIGPTLGPVHRTVIIEKESKVGRPELLDDGAVIARRIIQLKDRDEDMGPCTCVSSSGNSTIPSAMGQRLPQ